MFSDVLYFQALVAGGDFLMRSPMELALEEARRAGERGEVPVGAVLVDETGLVLARAGNRSIELHDPSGHAEMLALREAGRKIGNYRLPGTTLYVTLEPCIMCAGAFVHARISRLVYGAMDPKAGAIDSVYSIGSDNLLNHRLLVQSGIMAEESANLLRAFFKDRRKGCGAGEGGAAAR
jgi:tRNA(adenine34) deaminase